MEIRPGNYWCSRRLGSLVDCDDDTRYGWVVGLMEGGGGGGEVVSGRVVVVVVEVEVVVVEVVIVDGTSPPSPPPQLLIVTPRHVMSSDRRPQLTCITNPFLIRSYLYFVISMNASSIVGD